MKNENPKNCFTVDENSLIDPHSYTLLENLWDTGHAKFFEVKNGRRRAVVCVNCAELENFLLESSLLLIQGIDLDIFNDEIRKITFQDFIEGMS